MILCRRYFRPAACAAIFAALAPAAFAHAPFDCSTRVIVHETSAEVMVTVGSELGADFLRAAQLTPGQLPAGHPHALNPGLAANFFTVTVDRTVSAPREADVIGDGLEFQFHFEYALTPAKTLRLQSQFLPSLRPPQAAPLVLTDENGNLLGSAILAPGREAADFALPEKLFPSTALAAAVPVPAIHLPTSNSASPAVETSTHPGFGEFLKLGIGHILDFKAFDHLLFLTALLLGCQRLKPMLLVITGFTLAHSLTLALAALNLVTISSRVIEPLIAASILFVAMENFRRSDKSWPRLALTCGFGLIHGFGFAGVLRDSGLAGSGLAIAQPLLAFNLGVEMGQLTVAAGLLPLLLALNRWPWYARHGTRVISGLVMLVAVFWLWQRL